VSAFANQGNGTFGAPVYYGFAAAAKHGPTILAESVAAADLNGDGRPDLAVTSFRTVNGAMQPDGSSVSVLLNTCMP
jgi:hypothetical protein